VKGRTWLLILPLALLLAVSLLVTACGEDEGTTTSVGATTTSSEAVTTTSSEAVTTSSEGATTTSAAAGTTTTTGAGGVPTSIEVQLTGSEEVPPVQTEATGTFTLTISMGGEAGGVTTTAAGPTTTAAGGGLLPAGLTVSFKLEVANMKDVTAAHIHLGATGQNGDVIYPLFTGPQKSGDFSGVLAEGPLTEDNLTGPYQGRTFTDLIAAVLQGQTYVNVHTVANPNGEIRGQLIIDMGAGGTTTTSAGGAATTPVGATTSSSAGGY
jgi:hypothetical protein